MASPDQSSGPATAGKAARIIEAAREAFLEQGYDGVSMDEVAKRAGVAKQTVYSHYASKDALFLAVADSVQARMLSALSAAGSPAIRERLKEIAHDLLAVLLAPTLLSLIRVTLAASHRFPKLGHTIYETRIRKTHAVVAGLIEQAVKDGGLQIDDAPAAAELFFVLVRGELHFHCVVDPSFRPSPAEIDQQVDAAIDCFMARYGAPEELPA